MVKGRATGMKESIGTQLLEGSNAGGALAQGLDAIALGTPQELGDVQRLSLRVVDPEGRGLGDHWQRAAKTLLDGLILHVLYKRQREGTVASLAAIDDLVADSNRPRELAPLWIAMMDDGHQAGAASRPVVRAAAQDMLDRPDEEASAVLCSLKSYLEVHLAGR
jgi:type IV secretion system protein VirD4